METSTGSGLEAAGIYAGGLEGFEVAGLYRIGLSVPGSGVAERQGTYETLRDGRPALIRMFAPATAGQASELLAGFGAGQRLRHPNLLEVYDFGEASVLGTPCVYVVTERPDENLAGVLRERALDAAETRQILEGVIPALEFLHDHGYVHGRLRPSEVLACGETVKLSADGIRPVSAGGDFGDAPGLYGAPETATGRFGPEADAWSLAVLTLESLTRSPYMSEIDRLSAPFREIVEGGLRRDTGARWTSGRMSAALSGELPREVCALPAAAAMEVEPKRPRYRRFAGLAVGCALAAAAVCVLLIRSAQQVPAAPPVTIQAPPVVAALPAARPEVPAVPAGWAVVGAAFRQSADAEKRAAEMRRAHPKLAPHVFLGGERYLVVLGSGFSNEAQGRRQLTLARREGAPRDSYLTRFR